MADIGEIHEKVLAFLLEWRATRDSELTFALAQHPRILETGNWFQASLQDPTLVITFWYSDINPQSMDKTIWIGIDEIGNSFLRLEASADPTSDAFLKEISETIGGFEYVEGWIRGRGLDGTIRPSNFRKIYPGTDFVANLQLFLENDKKRIDDIILKHKADELTSYTLQHLLTIDKKKFRRSMQAIAPYRTKLEDRMLALGSITIENTGLFSSLSLDFGRRATALIGENGCGKTTILRAAALGIMGTGSPLVKVESSELQNFPKIREMDDEANPIYEGDGQISVSYKYNGQLFENGNANVIGFRFQKTTGQVVFTDRIDPSGFGLPAGESDQDEELPYLVIGYPQRYGSKSDGTNILKRSKAPNAYDVIPLILKTADNRMDSLKVWISESWNANGPHKKKVIALFKLISEILSLPDQPRFEIEVLHAISAQKIVVSTPANPEGILYDLLSTGLENLFGWLGHLISRMYEAYRSSENPLSESAIVFIDEIDNYLHPEVQVRLMKVLLETFPKTQFIFTAHSPFILNSLPSKDAKAYRIENGKAVPIRHFYGQSIQNISYEQFGIKKRPVEIQSMIDEMTWAFALEDLSKAKELYDELLPILGDQDPAILDAQRDMDQMNISYAPN